MILLFHLISLLMFLIIEDIDYLLKEYNFKRNIGKTYFMSKHKKGK